MKSQTLSQSASASLVASLISLLGSTVETTKLEQASLAEMLAMLRPDLREVILADLTDAELGTLEHDWGFWGRPKQQEPARRYLHWLILAGRGFGKTRTGVEWLRKKTKVYPITHLVGPTAADVRDTMVEGESGVLRVTPKHERPRYEPSKRKLSWPNGAISKLFSAEEPERLRGPQCYGYWADELGAWRHPQETWDQLMFGFRLGRDPRGIVTTTPKPIKLIKELLSDSDVVVTSGSTYENLGNLAQAFIRTIIKKYEGTRLGAQELYAQILDDVPGALWKHELLDSLRVRRQPPTLIRIVVAIDPAASSGEDADETGIIVVGVAKAPEGWHWEKGLLIPGGGQDLHGYVLDDRSGRYKPHEWATIAIKAFQEWGADRIIGEVNNGGEMIENTLRTIAPNITYRAVHASRGKKTRAEPISALYEQGRVHHVGSFSLLEGQMCTWVPLQADFSPDRMDALVWGLTELLIENQPFPEVAPDIDMTGISNWFGGGPR